MSLQKMHFTLQRFVLFFSVVIVATGGGSAFAQNIQLDHPVRCGKLTCFPSADSNLEYFYLPQNPHVALNNNGKPEFSFLRYVEHSPDSDADGGIVDADGGGIIHFLVDYSVTDKQLNAARDELKDIDENATIRGPIVFESGNFALVSSFALEDDEPSDLTRQVLGVGRAPLIEGLKAAVSLHLTKKGSQILWRSFQMETPDVSLIFEMSFSGLRDPAEATITANWEKLQDSADTTLGAKVSYLGIGGGFDYRNFWETARDTGAINIEYKGDPDRLQAIVDRAYARLHELMFEPIEINDAVGNEDDDPLQALSSIAQQSNQASYSAPWEVKINGGYKRRKLNRTGSYVLNFRQRSQSTLTTAMSGNIGGLFNQYGDDETVFRTINISLAPEYRVREVSVALDARDESEFTKYINSVSLSLRKKHGNTEETLGQLTFRRQNYETGRPQKLRYGWKKEPSVEEWMNYEYKADWSFVGGATHSSEWVQSDQAAITLTPPYHYKEIEFLSSPDILTEEDVRMVSVRVEHDFFGKRVNETINLMPSREEYSKKRMFAVPPGNDAIKYQITWTLHDRSKRISGPLSSDETVIFCDELPPRI